MYYKYSDKHHSCIKLVSELSHKDMEPMEWLNCININLYNVMALFIEIYSIGQHLLCTTLTIDHMALTIDHMDHVTLTVVSVH